MIPILGMHQALQGPSAGDPPFFHVLAYNLATVSSHYHQWLLVFDPLGRQTM